MLFVNVSVSSYPKPSNPDAPGYVTLSVKAVQLVASLEPLIEYPPAWYAVLAADPIIKLSSAAVPTPGFRSNCICGLLSGASKSANQALPLLGAKLVYLSGIPANLPYSLLSAVDPVTKNGL